VQKHTTEALEQCIHYAIDGINQSISITPVTAATRLKMLMPAIHATISWQLCNFNVTTRHPHAVSAASQFVQGV
jgi:hypothetical protein